MSSKPHLSFNSLYTTLEVCDLLEENVYICIQRLSSHPPLITLLLLFLLQVLQNDDTEYVKKRQIRI